MKTELRKYGASSTIDFVLYALDGIKFAPSIAFATGDIKLSLDEGAEVNATNLPVLVGSGYALVLTAAEQTAARISVRISDQTATQVWLDTAIEIETYGNALAQHEVFPSNIVQVDNDPLSAQNVKNQFDGTTGLIGDNFPARQDQLEGTGTGSGGNNTRVGGFSLTTGGVASGTYEDTFTLDNVYHQLTDSAGNLDAEYFGSVGTNGTAQVLKITGRINSNNDDLDGVYAWNYVTLDWDRLGDYNGKNNNSDDLREYDMDIRHTGIGAEDGNFRVRFLGSGLTSANFYIDKIAIGFGVVTTASGLLHSGLAQGGAANTITLDAGASSIDDFYVHAKIITTYGTGAEQENIITDYDGATKIATVKTEWKAIPNSTTGVDVISGQVHAATAAGGYNDGAVYIDTTNGVDGTLVDVNGTITRPVKTMAIARTLCDNPEINSNRIVFDKGVDVATLDQDYVRFTMSGRNGIPINAAGFDTSLTSFVRLVVTGTFTSNTALTIFETCLLTEVDAGAFNLINVGIAGNVKMSEDGGTYTGSGVVDQSPMGSTSSLEFDSGATGILLRIELSGLFTIKGMTANDTLVVRGDAQLTFDSSNNGGLVYRSGDIKTTDNSTVSPVFIGGVINEIDETTQAINTKVDDIPNNTDFIARTLESADYGTRANQTIIEAKVDAIGTITSALPSASDIDTELSSTHGAGSWEGGGGGSSDWTSGERNQIRDALGVDGSKTTATSGQLQDKLNTSSYTAPDNVTIGVIDAKVDAIGTIVSDQPNTADFEERTLLSSEYGTLTGQATINSNVLVVDGKVDALGISVGDIPNTAAFEARTLPSADYGTNAKQDVIITNIGNLNDISVAQIFAGGDVDGYSLDEALRVVVASSAGKTSGSGATAFTIRNVSDTKDVISATVDLIGNRTATIVDAS